MGAKPFRHFRFRAPRVRPGGNICAVWWSGRAKRQQGFYRGYASSPTNWAQRHGPGLAVAGSKPQAGPGAFSGVASTPRTGTNRRREIAPGKNPEATLAAAAWIERTDSRIEAPSKPNKENARADRRLSQEIQETTTEIH